MSAQEYRVGELVDIEIKGARVVEATDGVWVMFATGGDMQRMTLAVDDPAVTITQLWPAEGPPRPGDVWVDRYDDPWVGSDGGDLLAVGAGIPEDADYVRKSYGPLRLVHRKTDGGESGD